MRVDLDWSKKADIYCCPTGVSEMNLTVVIDKGMNAEDNFAWIDEHARIHFITTYSTYFAHARAIIDPVGSYSPCWRKRPLREDL